MRYGKWRVGLMLGLVALGQAAASQADDEAVLRSAQTVMEQYKIYATCSALFPGSLELVQELWTREVASGADYLKNSGKNKLLLLRYQALVGSGKLYDPQMPLGEAAALCERNKEALTRYHSFDFLRMANELEQAAGGNGGGQQDEATQKP